MTAAAIPRVGLVLQRACLGVVVLLLCACQAGYRPAAADAGAMAPMPPEKIAHERALIESLVAMLQPGTRLCRETTYGIGMRERVEGESQGVSMATKEVMVKITRLGQGPFMVAGREVKLGETLRDNPLDWTPCR